MKKTKKLFILILCLVAIFPIFSACGSNQYRDNPQTEDDIKYDIVRVTESVRVADGFLATYATVIPSVFVEGEMTLSYEKTEVDGEELYIAIVSGEYYPDYKDKESTKQGTIKFLMDLNNPVKRQRAKAPWPYEDPDGIDDVIWRYVTHKDIDSRNKN